jgi:hypothetical protein
MDHEAQHESHLAPPVAAPAALPVAAPVPSLSAAAAGMGNAAFGTIFAAGRSPALARSPRVGARARPGGGDLAVARATVARRGEHTCKCGGTGASCTCGGHDRDDEYEEEQAQLARAVARRVAREPLATEPEPNASVDPGQSTAPPAAAEPATEPASSGGPPIGPPAPIASEPPPAGPNQSETPGGQSSSGSTPEEVQASGQGTLPPGFVIIPTQDPEIACKPGTPGLNFDVMEALGAAGPVGEHMPAPVPKIPDVPHPTLTPPKLLDPSVPPPSGNNERIMRETGALLGLSIAIKAANSRGPQIAGAAGISNDQLAALQPEMGKAEAHSKKATEAQTALKRDAAAIRALPAVRAAATAYQEKYRAFEKTVRDTKPKVHAVKSAAAALASVQAAAASKQESGKADAKQAEVDRVKKQAETILNVGLKAVEGFKSGGWMGAVAGVGGMAQEAIAAEAKSLAAGMIAKVLKPDLAETELAIANARGKAARLADEAEAKALEAKLEDFNRAASELSNAQKDVEAAANALMEAEGGFGSALKSAGLTGAIKAIALRREMRQLHGNAMKAVNAYDEGLSQNQVLVADAVQLYTTVLNMACNVGKAADVSATMGMASMNLGSVKMFRGWSKREVGAAASDRTKLGDWLAGYDVLADDLTAILAQLPK